MGIWWPVSDILQVGPNMQNFPAQGAGAIGKPYFKAGPGCHDRGWLMAAEYILAEGNDAVILCERGKNL